MTTAEVVVRMFASEKENGERKRQTSNTVGDLFLEQNYEYNLIFL